MTALALFAALPSLLSGGSAQAAEPSQLARLESGAPSEGITKQLAGGAVLHLGPGTRIELGRTLKLQLGPPGSVQTVTQVIKVISGRVEVDIPLSKVPKTAVLIQAPRKVSAVAKGGHSIAIADDNRVTLAAVDGDMLAASGNDWKTLPSGQVRGFVGRDSSYEQSVVPGVPSLSISQPLLLALGGTAQVARAQTGGVKEAERYQLSIWRVGEKGQEFVRRVDARGASVELGSLPPGQYQVSARAVDQSGIFGPDSPPSKVRVVGAELPSGARYEEGTLLLGQRGRVKLLGADGLEASYGASETFVAAPDTVGLSRGEGTVLRLREPGTTSELRVALEPRTLRAEVHITPKHPNWPEDMIEVTVLLFDARGHAVNEAVQVKPSVMVDVTPVSVNWLRSENTLHAFIPAPSSRGPWVVRVEVSDEFGEPAGRDFMEVAAPTDRVSAR